MDEWSYVHQLVQTIISVLDARDPYTYEHSERVALISELIAKEMNIEEKYVDLIHIAAHLHDIGKIGVPDNILNKKGLLNDIEFEIIKSHPRIGYNIVKNIEQLKETSKYILHHHEKWDGSGYPIGLAGRDIPLGARIIGIADCFDAMTSKRTYKNKMSYNDAFDEILKIRGSHLCPDSVDSFMKLKDRLPSLLDNVNLHIKHKVFKNEERSLSYRAIC